MGRSIQHGSANLPLTHVLSFFMRPPSRVPIPLSPSSLFSFPILGPFARVKHPARRRRRRGRHRHLRSHLPDSYPPFALSSFPTPGRSPVASCSIQHDAAAAAATAIYEAVTVYVAACRLRAAEDAAADASGGGAPSSSGGADAP